MADDFQRDVEFVVHTIASTAVAREKDFGELDAVVGDGDLGYSLARGFEKVLEDWDSLDRSSPGTFLKKVAVVVTSRVGGTSGPLWGTAFLRAGASFGDSSSTDGAGVVAALRAAIAGIKARGHSDVGDKTLLDALVPATDVLEQQVLAGADSTSAVTAFADELERAAAATSTMEARRGRASYTGERSIGSPDAGATAVAQIGRVLAQTWESRT